MRNEKQVVRLETEFKNLYEEEGLETFLKALQIFASSQANKAGRQNHKNLEAAWRSVDEALRNLEKVQTESELEAMMTENWGNAEPSESISVASANVEDAWATIDAELSALEQLQSLKKQHRSKTS